MFFICVICGDNPFLINRVMKRCTNTYVCMYVNECNSLSCIDSLRPHKPYSPWNSPGQNTGVLEWVACPSEGMLPNISPSAQLQKCWCGQKMHVSLPVAHGIFHFLCMNLREWNPHSYPCDEYDAS